MSLTEEERKKIEEEEKYRAELKKQLGNETGIKKEKKKGMGCLAWGIVVFFGLGVFGTVISSLSPKDKLSTSPSTTESSQKELTGDIKFTGTQFSITNLDNTDWKVCSFEVNGKYRYPTKTSDWESGQKIDVIKAGETVTVGFANFTLKDGTRFNAFQTKPQSFSASCSNGFGYWEW